MIANKSTTNFCPTMPRTRKPPTIKIKILTVDDFLIRGACLLHAPGSFGRRLAAVNDQLQAISLPFCKETLFV